MIAACLSLLLVLLPGVARAEEGDAQASTTVRYDCDENQDLYADCIAALNRGEIPAKSGAKSTKRGAEKTGELTAILCMTDGREVDFGLWSPAYVVTGPDCRCTLYFTDAEAAEKACSELSETDGILYAEPDAEVFACGTETEGISFLSYGARRMNYGPYLDYVDSNVDPVDGGSIIVAVVDSGVYPHPFYVSRMTESGKDYVDNDNDSTNDPFGHGTNVAGILADCTQGTKVFLYPVRVLDDKGGGKVSNVDSGIRAAVARGCRVINLSLATRNGTSTALDNAVRYALGQGCTVIVAAGNDKKDTSDVSPANVTDAGILVVGSADSDGLRSSFSNYGASVDVYAYGRDIYCCANTGEYIYNSGTSFSAPHISGLSALLLLLHPELSPAQIEYRITRAAPAAAVNIPNLSAMIPRKLGFRLENFTISPDNTVTLYNKAIPATAEEQIAYTCDNPAILTVEDGILIPQSEGDAVVTASCFGLEPCTFTVHVAADSGGTLRIPSGTVALEDEAFYGTNGFSHVLVPEGTEELGDRVFDDCTSLRDVSLPGTLSSIGENSFSGAVLYCPVGSDAETYAAESGLNYILTAE